MRVGADGPVLEPLEPRGGRLAERLGANATALVHPFELSAKTMLAGLLGFLAILVADSIVVGPTLHEPAVGHVGATQDER